MKRSSGSTEDAARPIPPAIERFGVEPFFLPTMHTSSPRRVPLSPLVAAVVALLALRTPSAAQTWQRVVHPGPPNACLPLLLTDGTVIVHEPSTRHWHRLTPTASGSYLQGTWSRIADMPLGYAPLYFASAVLADGRVIVEGGEYNHGNNVHTNRGAVYDPRTDEWTSQAAPSGWANIGDAQCSVLSDGRFFLANAVDSRCAVLDPATLSWMAFGVGKACSNNEEGWTLLPDGSLLTVDTHIAPATERFLPTLEQWISAGNTPQSLTASGEMGPAVLRPNGTVFATGASGRTAIYTPPAVLTDPGTWAAGPSFPLFNGTRLAIADGPICLLPSGRVLCDTSPGVFNTPTRFFEFDGTSLISVPRPPRADQCTCFQGNMLVLPTGQILFTDQSSDVEIYTPTGAPQDAWRPTIASFPALVAPGEIYTLTGTQFNGLSQASMYGDDSTNATNYPLVRLTSTRTGHVYYARTFDHSTMAVATGSATTSTHFTLPSEFEPGTFLLEVVTNGIPSLPVTVITTKTRASHGTPGTAPDRGI